MDTVELIESRPAAVGAMGVRRALPTRALRTVGAWCFADHMGPAEFAAGSGAGIGPHPHMGLQTVTWLFDGELVHRDSLGTEQSIRPGQLNVMTAGRGVSHAEESPDAASHRLHGLQLWVALPDATRDADPGFEHHGELPRVALAHATATVLVGRFADAVSPVPAHTDHVGVELVLGAGSSAAPVARAHEHALVVVEGAVRLNGAVVADGQLGYLGTGHDELEFDCDAPARAVLLAGTPFDEHLVLWWNYVARGREEVVAAHRSWTSDDGRFGTVASSLPRTMVDPPAWAPPGEPD